MKKTIYLRLSDDSLVKEENDVIIPHIIGDQVTLDVITYTIKETKEDSKIVDGELVFKTKTYKVEQTI